MRIFLLLILILSALMFWLAQFQQDNQPVGTLDLSNWMNNNGGNFKSPVDKPLSFPEDHGEHSGVQSESWRFSGMLQDRKGKNYGFQAAFFRLNMGNDLTQRQSAWAAGNIYRVRTAVTSEHANGIIFKQRTSRDALDLAGYRSDQQKLWLHNWQLRISHPPGGHSIFTLQTDKLLLTLQALKPAIEMSLAAQLKFYGISRLQAHGSLLIDGQTRSVSGVAFFDHAWGNLPMGGGQLVWNRFFLQMSNKTELVILQSRRRDGSGTPVHSGYLIDRNGKVVELSRKQFELNTLAHWQSQKSGIRYPLSWEIIIPDKKLTLTISALINEQEINDALVNWSGTVQVVGESAGSAIQGSGLLQLTGYKTEP